MSCFYTGDSYISGKGGLPLLTQACLCPAALLAANTTLLENEESLGQQEAPCSSCTRGLAIGPRGSEVFTSTCRSQLLCGLLCIGLPIVYNANLIQRQRIRDKYKLRPPGAISELAAGCCYPCSLFHSHIYLLELQDKENSNEFFLRQSVANGKKGPLNAGLAHSRRLQEADSREARAIGIPLVLDDLDKLPDAAAAVVTVADRPAPAPPTRTRETSTARSLSFSTAMDPAPTEASTPGVVRPTGGRRESIGHSGGESGNREQKEARANSEEQHHEDEVLGPEAREEQVVVLFQRDRAPHPAAARRAEPSQASSGASSGSPGAVSRGRAASNSIPPPEETDSPNMRRTPGATTSCGASSAAASAVDSGLGDSANFPPAALPLALVVPAQPAATPQPPQFAVPPAFKPPDSADSEVMAAWMQGPKLSHLLSPNPSGQTLAQEECGSTCPPVEPSHTPCSLRVAHPNGTAVTGSVASLFSLNLDTSSPHISKLGPTQPAVTPPPVPSVTPPGLQNMQRDAMRDSDASPRQDQHRHLGAAATAMRTGDRNNDSGSSTAGPAGQQTVDTITSSKLSAMIDMAMLSGVGSSAAMGNLQHQQHGDVAPTWDTLRGSMLHGSVMATIAEGEDGTAPCATAAQVGASQQLHSSRAGQMRDSAGPSGRVAAALAAGRPGQSAGERRSIRGGLRGSSMALSAAAAAAAGASGSRPPAGSRSGSLAKQAAVRASIASSGVAQQGRKSAAMLADSGAGSSNKGARASSHLHASTSGAAAVQQQPQRSVGRSSNGALLAAPGAAAGPGVRSNRYAPRSSGAAAHGVGNSADNFSQGSSASSGGAGGAPQSSNGSGATVAGSEDALTCASSANSPAGAAPVPMQAAYASTAGARAFGVGAAPAAADEGDDFCNLASIRPTLLDGPEMQHLKDVLRAAGEPPPLQQPHAPAAVAVSGAPQADRASLTGPTTAAVATMAAAGAGPGGRYAPPHGVVDAGGYLSVDPGLAERYAAAINRGLSGGKQQSSGGCGGATSEEASSAIDGPVSSDEASAGATVRVLHRPVGSCVSAGESSASAAVGLGFSGAVAAAAASPAGPAASASTTSRAPAASASTAALMQSGRAGSATPGALPPMGSVNMSVAEQSMSGLSNGNDNPYSDTADSASMSTSVHRQQCYVNWMAQSQMSVDTADSRVLSRAVGGQGQGHRSSMAPGRASRIPGPTTSHSVSQHAGSRFTGPASSLAGQPVEEEEYDEGCSSTDEAVAPVGVLGRVGITAGAGTGRY